MDGHETKIENEAKKRENFANMQTAFLLHTTSDIHMFHVPWFMLKMNYTAGAMLLVRLSVFGLHFHIFIPLLVLFRMMNGIGRFQYTSENIFYAMDQQTVYTQKTN